MVPTYADPVAKQRIARRMLDQLDVLVERMGDAYRAEVPEYAALSDEEMREEVLPVSRDLVDAFLDAVVHDHPPDVEQVGALQRMGRRRLEMGVPLEPMLHVYRVAGRTVWSALVAATEAGEEQALTDLGGSWMDFVDRAASIAASGYLDASHDHLRRLDARRTALVEGLLAATDAADVAALGVEFATPIAAAYRPVLVAADGVAARIDRLAAACPAATLSGHRGRHVLLLVPGDADLADIRRRAGDALVVHGALSEPGPALTAEVHDAQRLVELGWAAGRRGELSIDDLVVDQLVAAGPRLAANLAARVLGPLRAGDRTGVLVTTLVEWLATGAVPEVARREVVHPNTVAYRLRRVAELTGLDPRIPNEAVVLLLALTAEGQQTAGSANGEAVDPTTNWRPSSADSG